MAFCKPIKAMNFLLKLYSQKSEKQLLLMHLTFLANQNANQSLASKKTSAANFYFWFGFLNNKKKRKDCFITFPFFKIIKFNKVPPCPLQEFANLLHAFCNQTYKFAMPTTLHHDKPPHWLTNLSSHIKLLLWKQFLCLWTLKVYLL